MIFINNHDIIIIYMIYNNNNFDDEDENSYYDWSNASSFNTILTSRVSRKEVYEEDLHINTIYYPLLLSCCTLSYIVKKRGNAPFRIKVHTHLWECASPFSTSTQCTEYHASKRIGIESFPWLEWCVHTRIVQTLLSLWYKRENPHCFGLRSIDE